jgi:hypothetical protein
MQYEGPRTTTLIYAATCASVMLAALACNPRNIVLGRGEVDAGSTAVSSSFEPATAGSPSGTSEVVASASNESGSSGTAAADSRVASQLCQDVYTTCMTQGVGSLCHDVLIQCELTPPDGGTIDCEDVYPQCLALGYSEQDCERAAMLCEDGTVFELTMGDSTLSAEDLVGD